MPPTAVQPRTVPPTAVPVPPPNKVTLAKPRDDSWAMLEKDGEVHKESAPPKEEAKQEEEAKEQVIREEQ